MVSAPLCSADSDALSLSSEAGGKTFSVFSEDVDLQSIDQEFLEQKNKMLTLQLEEANKSLKHERG